MRDAAAETQTVRVRLLCPSEGYAEIDEHEGNSANWAPHVDRSELHDGLELKFEEKEEIPAPVGVHLMLAPRSVIRTYVCMSALSTTIATAPWNAIQYMVHIFGTSVPSSYRRLRMI